MRVPLPLTSRARTAVAAALWLIEPDWESVENRLAPFRRWLYREI